MKEIKSYYAEMLRATTIFGGVQVSSILSSIIKTKVIAWTIGPTGIGLIAIFTGILNMAYGFLGAGIEIAGLKFLQLSKNSLEEGKALFILKKMVYITGFLIGLLIIIFSSFFSFITFGNKLYITSFILLSLAVFFKYLTSFNLVVLQSFQKIKFLAITNITANLLSLLVTVPLFYYFKVDAILPSMILSTIITFILSAFFVKKLRKLSITSTNKIVYEQGKSLISNAALYSISGALPLLSSYIIYIYIQKIGGIIEVGYCNVGFAILNVYVGSLFGAMSTDYFPRLNAVRDNSKEICNSVNQQATFGLLLITPIIISVYSFSEQIISVLFSNEFSSSTNMVKIGILAMIFKVVSFSLGYVLVVKAESKFIIKTSLLFNIFYLLIIILCYKIYGIAGIGIGIFVHYVVHFTALIIIVNNKYQIKFNKNFINIFVISLIFIFSIICINFSSSFYPRLINSIILIVISCFFSFIKLYRMGGFAFFKKQ